jgi:hypothetical protein
LTLFLTRIHFEQTFIIKQKNPQQFSHHGREFSKFGVGYPVPNLCSLDSQVTELLQKNTRLIEEAHYLPWVFKIIVEF